MRKASAFLRSKLRTGEVEFNLAMLLLFSLSVLAMRSGVAPMVGAFLAGLTVGESVSPKVRDFGKGVSELLTPFFLAGIGLRLDLIVFRVSATLKLTALIVIAAVASTLIGCGLGVGGAGRRLAVRVG